jgi:hypothetical protein
MDRIARVLFLTAFVFVSGMFAQTMPIGLYGQIPVQAGNATVCAGASGTVAMTANMMSTVAITNQSGALTCTFPSSTELCALFPFVASSGTNNYWWDFYLVNNGTGTVTTALGAGMTNGGSAVTGTLTVAAASVKHFIIVLTACGTPTVPGTPTSQLFSLGTSVF